MIANEKAVIPWRTLARYVGPMLIWLALSYILMILLMNSDFIHNAFSEETVAEPSLARYGAIVAAIVGLLLTFWGYTKGKIDFVPRQIPAGVNICPKCGEELLASTTLCPYCGTSIGVAQLQENYQNRIIDSKL